MPTIVFRSVGICGSFLADGRNGSVRRLAPERKASSRYISEIFWPRPDGQTSCMGIKQIYVIFGVDAVEHWEISNG